jgi:4-hydroxyphenylpyruvate dioxygenase
MADFTKPSERKLVGFDNFVRHNPMSDKFDIQCFHHIEFWTSDATNTSRRFQWGLGLRQVAKSDMSTGNKHYASSVCSSNEITFVFTAPYGTGCDMTDSECPHPVYDKAVAHKFISDHGLAVRAMGIKVGCAATAFTAATANGGVPVLAPQTLTDAKTGEVCVMAEVKMFDDVVMRFMSGNFSGPFIPKYEPVASPEICYGLQKIDHAVSNVPNLFAAVDYLAGLTGFHEFGEFTAADVGTVDSGLNSMVSWAAETLYCSSSLLHWGNICICIPAVLSTTH